MSVKSQYAYRTRKAHFCSAEAPPSAADLGTASNSRLTPMTTRRQKTATEDDSKSWACAPLQPYSSVLIQIGPLRNKSDGL